MRIVDDWLEDWISDRHNILADDVALRLREAARSDGYQPDDLLDAAHGDVDRFVRHALVSRLMSDAPAAPFEAMQIVGQESTGPST